MSDWTAGYQADITYTYGYYQELNPLSAKISLLSAGLNFPKIKTACELGYGQGISANLLAAASDIEWYGTDFNPSQAALAREMGEASGARIHLYDDSFAEFLDRSDLPDFDFIALHGIWSWVSDLNRELILRFIQTRLRVGGVLYISFNTHPGWSAFAPMRHLMLEHTEVVGSEGTNIVDRINNAIGFAEELLKSKPQYLAANPHVEKRLDNMKEQDRHYLAHEYFNKDWHPMHFSTLAEKLQQAKLSYASSAFLLDHIEPINLTKEQQDFLNKIPNRILKESARDFMVNQQFRRDYWVKGPRPLSVLHRFEQFITTRIMLIVKREDITLKVKGSLGEIDLKAEVYAPILDAIEDHEIHTLKSLHEQLSKNTKLTVSELIQGILVLISSGFVGIVQDEEQISKVQQSCDRLNNYLCNKARAGGEVAFLASPLVGGGVSVPRFQQLFLLAMKSGISEPEDWANFSWDILSRQGQRILKAGKPIESAEENLKELKKQAKEFNAKRLPILKALKIA